jgi:hypothetical protein
MRALVKWWALFLLLALAACADPEADALRRARSTWGAAGVTSYSFRYFRIGWMPRVDSRVTVTGGVVTDVAQLSRGEIDLAIEAAPTIESIFDTIEQSLDIADVEYDAVLGFPVRASFYDHSGEDGTAFFVSELMTSR